MCKWITVLRILCRNNGKSLTNIVITSTMPTETCWNLLITWNGIQSAIKYCLRRCCTYIQSQFFLINKLQLESFTSHKYPEVTIYQCGGLQYKDWFNAPLHATLSCANLINMHPFEYAYCILTSVSLVIVIAPSHFPPMLNWWSLDVLECFIPMSPIFESRYARNFFPPHFCSVNPH